MDKFPHIEPPYILGGGDEFVNMGLLAKALSSEIDALVKFCNIDSKAVREERWKKIEEISERLSNVTNDFGHKFSLTNSIQDLQTSSRPKSL